MVSVDVKPNVSAGCALLPRFWGIGCVCMERWGGVGGSVGGLYKSQREKGRCGMGPLSAGLPGEVVKAKRPNLIEAEILL